jgi:hypothetical protein
MMIVMAVALPATMANVAQPCLDEFNAGINNARVSEACQWVESFESCLGNLDIPQTETQANDISNAEGVLGASQIRYGCDAKGPIARRGTQMSTDDGNVNIDVDESRDFHVSRVYRDSVNIFEMNEGIKGAETNSADAAAELAQIKIDIAAERADITQIRQDLTDHASATSALAQLEERVSNLQQLTVRVADLQKQLATVNADTDTMKNTLTAAALDLESSLSDDADAFEADMLKKVAAAEGAAAEALEMASNMAATTETMPKGSVVQATYRNNENTGGSVCSQSYCVGIPHYGNNLNNYRKTPCYVQIVAARDNSWFFFRGNQYIYSIGGSHYYMDFKRQVQGGAETSLLTQNRKNSITDQIWGGHPSGGWDGIMNFPIFLDKRAAAKKGQTVKYTLWVASWSGGTMRLHGYPNNNERSLNTYNLWEIAA